MFFLVATDCSYCFVLCNLHSKDLSRTLFYKQALILCIAAQDNNQSENIAFKFSTMCEKILQKTCTGCIRAGDTENEKHLEQCPKMALPTP